MTNQECIEKGMEELREIQPPDMPFNLWADMLIKSWYRLGELEAAVIACREINDSGEMYNHENADGAQALANLFSMLE